jgi:hypothetical protein
VLPLVVSGAAAVDAVARGRRPPRIEPVPPFSRHAVDDIAMPVHQDGGRRRILAIFREQIGTFAGRRFDHARREIEFCKRRLQFFLEIRTQDIAALGVLAFGPIRDPTVEIGEEFAGMKLLVRLRDGIGSGHSIFFPVGTRSNSGNVSRYATGRKWAARP